MCTERQVHPATLALSTTLIQKLSHKNTARLTKVIELKERRQKDTLLYTRLTKIKADNLKDTKTA